MHLQQLKDILEKSSKKEALDDKDKPFVKDLVKKLRGGSKTHAKQADDLEKALKTEAMHGGAKKTGEDYLTKEDKQYLRDNPKNWKVTLTVTTTQDWNVEGMTREEAEETARESAQSGMRPDGEEIDDVSVDNSELDRCIYVDEEIEYLEEEVLDA